MRRRRNSSEAVSGEPPSNVGSAQTFSKVFSKVAGHGQMSKERNTPGVRSNELQIDENLEVIQVIRKNKILKV